MVGLQLLLLILGPRVLLIYYYFFTPWFANLFDTLLLPVLGFIFLPFTLLAYAVLAHWFPELTEVWRAVIMVVAVVIDLSSRRSTRW